MVLAHGFTQTGASWARAARQLRLDYAITCVDLPGHGESLNIRTDLRRGATLLGNTGGRAIYVGYSMGGRLALHLALARPDLVRRLVVLGATGGIEDPAEREARRAADEALAQRIETEGVDRFLDFWLSQPLFAGLPEDPDDRAARRTNTARGLASSLRLTGTGTQRPLWHQLHRLSMPVLVLAGERDEKFTALGQRLAQCIGNNATFDVIPDAGHASHIEAPERFANQVRAWLRRHELSQRPTA
ncbi:MAG: alpha/beta hydrolase [Acidimicrobiia bacterium]|nr:alpha/beta hydrolase [Acidimicrobiia bacterium]